VMKFKAFSFTDLFSISHNVYIPFVSTTKCQYINGSEFYCNIDGQRVDLLFVGFDVTDDLVRWGNNANKVRTAYQKELSEIPDFQDSWIRPAEFQKHVTKEMLREYVKTLPDYRLTIKEFQKAGASVILNRVPFAESWNDKLKAVKRVGDLGCMGIVVFRDVSNYEDESEEVGDAIDFCGMLKALPIVASGIYADYETWSIFGAEATDTFDWLTDKVTSRL